MINPRFRARIIERLARRMALEATEPELDCLELTRRDLQEALAYLLSNLSVQEQEDTG